MIRVTVEIVPYGDERRRHISDSIIIKNDASGDEAIGNYVAIWSSDDGHGASLKSNKNMKVKGFRRQQKHGALRLVREVLDACFR